MNILFISWFFPPANDVAALRTGAVARYLLDAGHKVHVLTALREHPDRSLAVPIPEEMISRTAWFDIDKFRMASPPVAESSPKGAGSAKAAKAGFPRLSDFRINLTHIPDRQIGWLKSCLREGRRIIRENKIDLILASAPPFTGHLAAKSLGRQFGIPWIAEYRDGWSRYAYTPRQSWRQMLDVWMENRTAKTASGIIAVSEPWADYYRKRFGRPTQTIYNGYDEDSILERSADADSGKQPLTLVHVGWLYGGLRDPSALYQAILKSGLSPNDLRVVYFGPAKADVVPLAERHGVLPFIDLKERVPHGNSLQIQRDSDILLLLQYPEDARNVPAKLFEYFAAQRPILGIGVDSGVPAQLICERGAGIYSSDPERIQDALRRWSEEKKRNGFIPDIPVAARAGLARVHQLEKLEKFLRSFAS
jgi:glycosyltransferase involved in cell wall biosynthesis